jgi:hypothetical protein
MNFERKFLRAAAQFLQCRLELIPTARDAEGLMLGMWDQAGEMRLICHEAIQCLPIVRPASPKEPSKIAGGVLGYQEPA